MFNFEKQQQNLPEISEAHRPTRIPRCNDLVENTIDVASAVYSVYVAHQFKCWDAYWENQVEMPPNYIG